jgi:hypothetical protein
MGWKIFNLSKSWFIIAFYPSLVHTPSLEEFIFGM